MPPQSLLQKLAELTSHRVGWGESQPNNLPHITNEWQPWSHKHTTTHAHTLARARTTTEWLNYWITELLDYWATELLNYWITELLNYWTTELPDHWTTELLNDWTTELLNYWITELLNYWTKKNRMEHNKNGMEDGMEHNKNEPPKQMYKKNAKQKLKRSVKIN